MALKIDQAIDIENKQTVEEIEWNRLKEFRMKEGFVEGKILGEESTFQNGFHRGYKIGFELCYPLNLIRGLLFANKLLLTEGNKTTLLTRSQEIKKLLDEFENKCNQLKLSYVKIPKDNIIPNDNNNLVDILDEKPINIDIKKLNEINIELGSLKEKILFFLADCENPSILNQVHEICRNWDCEQFIQREYNSKLLHISKKDLV